MTTYRPLTTDTVEAWLDDHPTLRAAVPGSPLHVREVGDGNLNLVFIVRDDPAHAGLVLKQSLPWVRVFGEGWPLTVERARHEADAYAAYQAFAGEGIPAYHGFDPTWYVIAMEDLADLRVWRGALNDGEVHAGAAGALGRFVARLAFHTSVFGMKPEALKRQAALATNPELCRITEDLVFSEPYTVHEHNWHHPGMDRVVAGLRADVAVRTEVAALKHHFMTTAEALIHGDLHTGSVMVGGGRTVAIDPEFAFYGPVAYDLGALWANAAIAAVRAAVLDRPADFRAHVADILPVSWAAFTGELWQRWPGRVDPFLTDAFLERWLASVWGDALGYAAAKAVRRMIGFAHVTDIETLEESARTVAAATVVRIARRLLLERDGLGDPKAAWSVVTEEIARS